MKYFNVPADFRTETIDAFDRLNHLYPDSRVIETYGNITLGEYLNSGRSIEQLPQVDWFDFQHYVEYSRSRDIEFNYTINAPHMQNREFTEEGVKSIKEFLSKLYEAGVRTLILSLPSLMEIVRSTGYDFKIKASVICQITNANKAMFYKNLGVERIVVDESVNRDFRTLRMIRDAFGDKVEVIANTICHRDCTYRMFHYNQLSQDSIKVASESSNNYYPHRCMLRRYENIGNLLKLSWIRPEDLHYYTSIGIEYFKLQGRQAILKGDIVRAVECYFKESYQGDLIELLDIFAPHNTFNVKVDNQKLAGFLKPFFEKDGFCRSYCSTCNYCESFARKCIDFDVAEKVILLAREFYHQYDQFSNMLQTIETPEPVEQHEMEFAIDFALD